MFDIINKQYIYLGITIVLILQNCEVKPRKKTTDDILRIDNKKSYQISSKSNQDDNSSKIKNNNNKKTTNIDEQKEIEKDTESNLKDIKNNTKNELSSSSNVELNDFTNPGDETSNTNDYGLNGPKFSHTDGEIFNHDEFKNCGDYKDIEESKTSDIENSKSIDLNIDSASFNKQDEFNQMLFNSSIFNDDFTDPNDTAI